MAEKLENTSDIFSVRLQKLDDLRQNGCDPYRQHCEQKQTSQNVRQILGEKEEDQTEVQIAGRIISFHLIGRAAFLTLLDRDGKIQCYVKRDEVGEDAYQLLKKLDIGDIIGTSGTIFRTSTGEVTVRVGKFCLVSKSLRALPEKFHGMNNSDQIYRQRYLSLLTNEESRNRAMLRIRILREIREFLWRREFVEVETPMLQNVAGGAAAKPFITHMNALDQDFYLRISLELYLKRMLIAGFDRVFEMGRVFRNEGLSRRHNPEFTMIELYQAYSDHRGMMALIYDLIQSICQKVLGTTRIPQADGTIIELGGKWREVSYRQLILDATGDAQWFSRSKPEKLAACDNFGIEVNPELEDFAIDNDVYEKMVEPTLLQPTFVTQLPRELCPLAKLNQSCPELLDVFELCIHGQEIAPAYSEQNDPLIQREMFEAQVGENKQALDNEFLLAMEYGMPPAGGMGIGIDRLVILLTGAANIRDVILYPPLKPQMSGD